MGSVKSSKEKEILIAERKRRSHPPLWVRVKTNRRVMFSRFGYTHWRRAWLGKRVKKAGVKVRWRD